MTSRDFAIRLLFVPTLLWNVLLSHVLQVRHWYDPVDDGRLLLGALPFPWTVGRLTAEGVTGVVNTCAEYGGPVETYRRAGIEQLYIPTTDFTPPTRPDIDAALAFIERHLDAGGRVYVHCKAGRGRSATVVMCWLVRRRGMTPAAAQQYLIDHRPHVNRGLAERAVVQAIHRESGSSGSR